MYKSKTMMNSKAIEFNKLSLADRRKAQAAAFNRRSLKWIGINNVIRMRLMLLAADLLEANEQIV